MNNIEHNQDITKHAEWQSSAKVATLNAGLGAGTFKIAAYRREWDGDESDLCNYVYAGIDEELDEYGVWEPLYAFAPNE